MKELREIIRKIIMESEGQDDKTIVLYYVVDKRGVVHHIADNKRQAEDNLEINKDRMKGSVVKSVEVPLEDWENDKIKEFNLINYIRKKKSNFQSGIDILLYEVLVGYFLDKVLIGKQWRLFSGLNLS